MYLCRKIVWGHLKSLIDKYQTTLSLLFITTGVGAILLFNPVMAIAKAQENDTARKNTSAELILDEDFNPRSGAYYYDVFLNSMRIGKATIQVRQDGDWLVIGVTAKTRTFLSSFYKIKYKGEAVVSPNPIIPVAANIEEQTGSKKKTTQMLFPRPDKITAVQIESKNGKESKRTEQEFNSNSFVFDPFTTVFLIRSLKWELGTQEIFDVFSGKKQYQLELICQGETVLDIAGKLRETWQIVPQTRSLEEPYKIKISGFVVYLSKDSKKEILKITGDPKIGRIVARMRKFSSAED